MAGSTLIARDHVPELPDVSVYIEALTERIAGQRLERVVLRSPFVLRSVDPPIERVYRSIVRSIRRVGKRIVLVFDDGIFLVIHLMIAGRFKWLDRGAKIPGKVGLAAFDFENGSLILTEAGSQRRASLYLVKGEQELASHDPGGLEVLTSTAKEFGDALTRESHTLKRALTDPHLLSGVGNAYSDEILHAAKLSPMLLTSKLTAEQIEGLHAHTIGILTKWRDDLIAESGGKFPEKVTAFREGMAAHGRYGKPCPVCGTPIQRIQYASNEANYCPTCQTGGKLLADRGLSRLLKSDWPKSLEELERFKESRKR